MNGVTILDTMEIYVLSFWQFVLGFTPLMVAAAICFIRLYKAYKKGTKEEQEQGVINLANYQKPFEFLYMVIGGILSLALLLCMSKLCPVDYAETHYKVRVDETASFIEFYDKYTILEEHPEYFIVTEKSK